MGVEGFSKPFMMQEMNPILGGKREILFLLAFMCAIPVVSSGRKKNEDGVANSIKTTNRYARMNLDSQSSNFSTWSA